MLVGIRKKHWLMFSLSVTCFLLLLVFTSKPIQLPKLPTGDAEIGFLRRHITLDHGQETAATSSPPAAPPPPPPPPEPQLDPAQALQGTSGVAQWTPGPPHLTEQERKDLAILGVLLVEDDQQQQQQQEQQEQRKQQQQQQQQDDKQREQEQVQPRQLTEYNPRKQQQEPEPHQQQQQQLLQLQQQRQQQQQQQQHLQQQQQEQQDQRQHKQQQLAQLSPSQSPPVPPQPQQQQQQKQQQKSQQQPPPQRQPQQPQTQLQVQQQQHQQTPQPQQQTPQPQQQSQQEETQPLLQQQLQPPQKTQQRPQPPQQPLPHPRPHLPRGSQEKRPAKPRRPARPRPRVPLPPPHSVTALSGGSEHEQWLRRVMAQHQDFLKKQHRLNEHHQQETQRLKQTLRQQDTEQQTARSPKTGSRATGSLARSSAPRVTYESLKRQGESAVRSVLKREFVTVQRDTNFTPGEVVDPSQVRRVLVLSTWRSGSTYLGDLLRAYPGTFYSFEPLHHLLKNLHLEDGPLVQTAQHLLRSILTCDYSHMDEYIAYQRNVTFLLRHNTRLWNSCALNRALCFDKDHVSRVCSFMPVNVLKTVRMGVSPVIKLLEDEALDLRVVHLVRDPRGCLHSRMQLSWCQSPACRDPATVCQDLLKDLTHSDQLLKKYSNRYMVVRYEDLGLKPEEKAREIFEFVGLSYNKYVSTYVKEHTTLYKKGRKGKDAYGTFRDSKATIFAWRGALDYEAVANIQDKCQEPLRRLGLRTFDSEEEYLNTTVSVMLQE